MDQKISKLRQGIFYALYFLLIGAVLFRMIPHYLNSPYQWTVIILLAVYLALFISERLIIRKPVSYFYFTFILELAIILALLIIPSNTAPKDYFINLVLPLCGQAVWNLPEKTAKKWVIIFCFFCLVSMVAYYQDMDGFSFGLTYIAGCLLISILSSVTLHADQARSESQALLTKLQIANRKLQDYAHQIEALAAAEERNRLARELHDSVSQTIFSMNLTAQSARILIERDPQRAAGLLDHLQSLSQDALAEMRSLIQQLRPHALIEDGLPAALKKHAAERLEQDHLVVNLKITEEGRLPAKVEEGLFRIAQEALNNVVKHANTPEASVELSIKERLTTLVIKDKGAGFDLVSAQAKTGHVGLASMRERAQALGGSMSVDSSPGKGARIKIVIDPSTGGESTLPYNNDLEENNQEAEDA